MESIKYFLYFMESELGVEPFWPILIIALLAISGLYPYHLKGKLTTKEKENGEKETKYYEYRDF